MNPATVIEIFTYQEYFHIVGRGPVITGHVEGNARKVRPGMLININGSRFTILGVERFAVDFGSTRSPQPVGLLVRGLKKKHIENLSEGDEFSILVEK